MTGSTHSLRGPIFACLAVANASQALFDVRVQRRGMARGTMFTKIRVGDIFSTAANLLGAPTTL